MHLQNLLTFFSKKKCELDTVLTRAVNILTTNELVFNNWAQHVSILIFLGVLRAKLQISALKGLYALDTFIAFSLRFPGPQVPEKMGGEQILSRQCTSVFRRETNNFDRIDYLESESVPLKRYELFEAKPYKCKRLNVYILFPFWSLTTL